MDKEYLDIDGNPITLDMLCIKDPAWAASRLRECVKDERRIKQLEAENRGLLNKIHVAMEESYDRGFEEGQAQKGTGG